MECESYLNKHIIFKCFFFGGGASIYWVWCWGLSYKQDEQVKITGLQHKNLRKIKPPVDLRMSSLVLCKIFLLTSLRKNADLIPVFLSIVNSGGIHLLRYIVETSLVVQWLGLHAANTAGVDSSPGQGAKIPHAV